MIGNPTQFQAGPFRIMLVLTVLLLFTGFAEAQITTQQALETTLTMRRQMQPADAAPDPIQEFYAKRNFRPAWSGSRRAEDAGTLVVRTLKESGAHGLRASDYDAALSRWETPPEAGAAAAAYDLSLTEDLLRYARHVRLGRINPSQVYADVALPARIFDAAAALNQALEDGTLQAFLDDLPPPHREYRSLMAALAHYREIEEKGGWARLPAKGIDPYLLTQRLSSEDPALDQLFPGDAELQQAVTRFQLRNGLAADGRIGGETLAALNVPVRSRIEQIAANLERWRWLPRQFEARTIRVNVPDQTVQYYRGEEALLTSRAAVGKLGSKTPIVRMMALSLTANPLWEVPDDIARGQILPKLRQNARYLADNNMVLINGPAGDPHGLTIDWRNLKSFSYRIDQKPGENNAMGNLMLDSPNGFGVYLHDTPGKDVFRPAARQKSNGCIRVEDMAELSALLVTDDGAASLDRLEQAVASGETERLMLDNPVPVYLLYWTAVAEEDGAIGFRSDFYGRDKPLTAALNGERPTALAQTAR